MRSTATMAAPIAAKAIAISTRAARAADITPTMPYVLGTSLALSASLMSLAWILPALAG